MHNGHVSKTLVKILPYCTLIWKTEFCAPSAKETQTGESRRGVFRWLEAGARDTQDRDNQVCLAQEAEGKTQMAVPS